MAETPQLLPAETRDALRNCFFQLRLTCATELAQSGRLLEAEAVRVQNGEQSSNASELDLLTRIAIRLGKFDETRRCWNTAIQREPRNEINCLNRLTSVRRIVRLIVHHQDTLLNILVLSTVAFAAAVYVYTFLH